VQLKATDHLRTSGDDVLHYCKVTTANYFLHRPEPVMYVVYDAREDTAYWLWVQPYLRGLDDASPGWREREKAHIRIPRANRLTRETIPLIADYVQAWWARVMAVVGREYPASPAEAPRPFQLPPDLPTFTGRDTYLDELDELLRPGSGQAVGLVGLAGDCVLRSGTHRGPRDRRPADGGNCCGQPGRVSRAARRLRAPANCGSRRWRSTRPSRTPMQSGCGAGWMG
jgi:hypothetical protein